MLVGILDVAKGELCYLILELAVELARSVFEFDSMPIVVEFLTCLEWF